VWHFQKVDGTAQNPNGPWEITDPSQKLCFRINLNLNKHSDDRQLFRQYYSATHFTVVYNL